MCLCYANLLHVRQKRGKDRSEGQIKARAKVGRANKSEVDLVDFEKRGVDKGDALI